VAGALNYSWTLPGGWGGSSTSNIISATASGGSGNITIIANNACGSSAAQILAVTVNPLPSTPGAISGNISVCQNSSNTYSVAAVVGATSYNWTKPVGWLGASATNIINTTASSNSGFVTVSASNACGTSAAASLSVTVNLVPFISVNSGSICNGNSFTMIPGGASTYTFFPAGPVVSPVVNTTYSVMGTSTAGCVGSNTAISSVTVNNTPATPGAISGSITICSGSSNTYSVAVVAGATSYIWTKPGGWTGVSTTNIINTTASSTSGLVSVSASNACGTSAAQTLSVTVNPIPATPGAISGNITICSGSSNQYSVAPVGGATSYVWTKPGGWTGVSTTNVINTTASSTSGFVTVTASNACGTSAAATLSVTVNTPPASPGAISGSVTLCSGQSSNYSVAPVSGASSYIWNLPAGWSGASITNIINGTCGNSGNISVMASNACGNSAAQNLAVTVNTSPTLAIAGGGTTICSGAVVTMTASGATSYSWSTGALTNTVSDAPLGTTSYTVIGTSSGCSAALTTIIFVNTTPLVTANASSQNICSGSTVVLTGGGANTYTWSGGVTDGVSFSPVSTANYTVTGSSIAGCTNTAAITVTVTNIPSTPSSIVGPTSICAGAPSTIYSVTPDPNASSFVWTLPGGWLGSSGTNTISTTPGINGGNISVTASNFCGTSSQQTLSVSVNPSPTLSLNGTPNNVCAGGNVTLSVSGASSYSWNTGAITASTVVNPTATIVYTATGTDLGCSSFSTITIGVFANPALNPASSTTMLCLGQSATITASGASTYTWFPSGSGASIVVSPTINTTYTVSGTNGNGCTATFVFTQSVTTCAGLSSVASAKEEILILYPNPFSDKITIVTSIDSRLQVFNAIGELVISGELKAGNNEIRMTEFANGIYFVRVGTSSVRVVKQN
jgi:hypothetical protein